MSHPAGPHVELPPPNLTPGSSDARRVKAAHCRETVEGGADLTVELEETSFESGIFTATIAATHPVSVHRTFCVWAAGPWGWSGHFFNLGDPDGFFHLRIRGSAAGPEAPGDDNVQLFVEPHGQATIIASETIVCTIEVNP